MAEMPLSRGADCEILARDMALKPHSDVIFAKVIKLSYSQLDGELIL